MVSDLLVISKYNYQQYKKIRYKHKQLIGPLQNERSFPEFNTIIDLDLLDINNNTGHKYCLIVEKNTEIPFNHIVGYVCYRLGKKSSKVLEIEIFEEYQGNGFAGIILGKIIDEARLIKSEYLSLFVFTHRIPAIQLYKKFNFTMWKVFQNGQSMRLLLN